MTKISMEIVDILQNHYPERLGVAFIHHAPWVWTIFWKMISPFLNDVTRNKVKMISKDPSPVLEVIDADQLEQGTTLYTMNSRMLQPMEVTMTLLTTLMIIGNERLVSSTSISHVEGHCFSNYRR